MLYEVITEGHQDLVPAFHHHPGYGGPDVRRPQREEIHARFRHGKHGGAEARGVFADPHLPRPFGGPEGQGEEVGRKRRQAMSYNFV